MLADFSREELLHELLFAPRSANVPLADTTILERPGFFQIVTPSLKQGGLNEIVCGEFEGDALLDEALDRYRSLGLRFRWTVAPGPRSGDLAAHLERRGLRRSESFGMANATRGAPKEPGGAITIEQVGPANVDDFTRVQAEGWQMDSAPLDDLHRRILADPARRHHLLIARHSGVAAAVGSYVALERSAYLIGAVVLPSFRGLGLYRALVGARLRGAEARGLTLATSLARAETSAPILAKLGFQTVCSIAVFTND